MKKIYTVLTVLLMAIGVFAQLPEKMSYQAVIRNSSDALVTNTQIGMQISILQGSASGTEVYVETQTPTTNANGLVSIEIGNGTIVSGDFSTIDWANGLYFIKTETDPTGGTSYAITGTSQLLSVPYALHAKTAETVTGGISETDPVYSQSVAAGITTVDTAGWNAKMDSYTETDSIYLASEAAKITSADITNLGNLSGINTGDQDITGIATNQQAIKNIRANMLTSEIDPIYAADSATINASIATNTQAIIDTALQLRTDLATKEALIDTASLLHSEIATNTQAIIDTALQLRTDLATKEALTDTAAVLRGKISTNQQAIIDTAAQLRTDLATKVALTDTATVLRGKIATNQKAIIDTASQLRTDLATKTALADSTAQVRSEIPDVPTGTQIGEMQYWNGSEWVTVPAGEEGQVLSFTGGVPMWKTEVGDNFVINFTTGKIWMDRNLGASQVATSSTDADSYGDFYQWGRGTDGHESRTSGITSTNATTAVLNAGNSWDGLFITEGSDPCDWLSTQDDNLWQGVSGTNNPCPFGYRLPTEAEWEAERTSWGSNNAAGAFASPLKLPLAGWRHGGNGSLDLLGSFGSYWSSTVDGYRSRFLDFSSGDVVMLSGLRRNGFSVRCLKD